MSAGSAEDKATTFDKLAVVAAVFAVAVFAGGLMVFIPLAIGYTPTYM